MQGGLRHPRSAAVKNIDTGMGLERMAALLQGVDNIYEIDTMWKVLERAAELTEQRYGRDHRTTCALRVVADHVRTSVMLVARRRDPVATRAAATCCGGSCAAACAICGCWPDPARRVDGSGRGADGERYLHELPSAAIERAWRPVPRAASGTRRTSTRSSTRRKTAFLRHPPDRHRDLRRGRGGDRAAATGRSAASGPSSCTTPTASRST